MGGKSSAHVERFLNPILPIAFTLAHVFHQIVANLPLNATKIVRLFKTFKTWVFLKNKNVFYSKLLKVANLL